MSEQLGEISEARKQGSKARAAGMGADVVAPCGVNFRFGQPDLA